MIDSKRGVIRMSLVDQATQYIVKKHEGQYRPGLNVPYSTHLFGVARILKAANYADDIVVAGLLHDVLEGTDATEEEIRGLFGGNILMLVKAVSEPDKSLSWEQRKQYMINRIKYLSEDAVAITLAEKIQNVRAIKYELPQLGESTWSYFNAGKDIQYRYYVSIIEQTKKYHPNAVLLPDLEYGVKNLFAPFGS